MLYSGKSSTYCRGAYHFMICMLLLLCFSSQSFAQSIQAKLPKQLSSLSSERFVQIPNQSSFFAFNASGDIYLLDVEEKRELIVYPTPIISLKQSLSVDNATLFAVALHPSFSLAGKAGSGTFYTAHRVPFDEKSSTVRLAQQASRNAYDIVVSEWIYLSHSKQVAENSKRELFRIASNDSEFDVKQLSFNPHLKPWQENYGILHVLLGSSGNNDSAIFSGSVLRINPTPFGLKQYTVPINNPYNQHSDIANEIALYNIEQPTVLVWQKNSHHDLLVHHYKNASPVVSSLSFGDNLKAVKPEYQFSLNDKATFSKLHYLAPNKLDSSPTYLTLDHDRAALDRVSFVDNKQHIEPSDLLGDGGLPANTVLLKVAESFIALYSVSDQVLMLMNYLPTVSAEKATVEQNKVSESKNGPFLYLTFIILVTLILWLNREKIAEENAKRKIRQQYARVEIIDGEVCLYNRHEETIAKRLNPRNIVVSELLLNQQIVNQVNAEELPFTNDVDADIKGVFNREYHSKMYGKRVRQVQLQLLDSKGKKYLICPYFRIGDQRYTKLHFKPSLALLIDFQWQISGIINPNSTPERKKEIIPDEAALKPAKLQVQRPALARKVPRENKAETPVAKVLSQEQSKPLDGVSDGEKSKPVNKEVQDTKIVDAIEKLVKLHQEGFLDDDEFANAKAKLLQSLVDQ